jgi:hypothetical protein
LGFKKGWIDLEIFGCFLVVRFHSKEAVLGVGRHSKKKQKNPTKKSEV